MYNIGALPIKPCSLGEEYAAAGRKFKATLLHTMRAKLSSCWKKENLKANINAQAGGNFLNAAELQPHGESRTVAHALPSSDMKCLSIDTSITRQKTSPIWRFDTRYGVMHTAPKFQ